MGLWAAYVLVETERAAVLPAGWVAAAGASPGWSAYIARTVDPEAPSAPWDAVADRMLVGVVYDSDFAILMGWSNGAAAFRWAVNGEASADHWQSPMTRSRQDDGGLERARHPVERASVVAAMCTWAGGGDADILEEIVSRTYTFAEAGLFAALAALDVVTNGLDYDIEALAAAENTLARPTSIADRLVLIGGDPASLPARPGRVYLAASIDHDSDSWADFVRAFELELWGEPGCLVVGSTEAVPAGGFAEHASWSVYLGSEPPLHVAMRVGQFGWQLGVPSDGPWHLVPAEYDDPAAAVTWARAHVDTERHPPAPVRERTLAEGQRPRRASRDDLPLDPHDRTVPPALVGQLYTYVDLCERADAVADWLDAARHVLIEPGIAAYGQVLPVRYQETNEPYAIIVGRATRSANDTETYGGADDTDWSRVQARMRAGDLHRLRLGYRANNGAGVAPRNRGGACIEIELRSRQTTGSGPLPDKYPATIWFTVTRPMLVGVEEVRDLFRRAAVEFDASLGYLHGSGYPGQQSPYEQRGFGHWHGQRLDTIGRGIHWGNLIGPAHREALGGWDRFTQLGIPLVEWSPALYWFEIADDPFGPVDDRADDLTADLIALVPPDHHGIPLDPADMRRSSIRPRRCPACQRP